MPPSDAGIAEVLRRHAGAVGAMGVEKALDISGGRRIILPMQARRS